MIQYLLTALAGVAIGIVGLRLWQAREAAPAGGKPAPSTEAAPMPLARKLLIGAAMLLAIALGALALRPGEKPAGPNTAAMPGAGGAPGQQNLADVDTMIGKLAERLAKNPQDGEGFRMLGWSLVMTGQPAKAIEPYKQAMRLLPKSALVHSGYGEALVGVAGGKVTSEAKAAFDKAVGIDPAEPRARYFLALHLAQNGQERQALDQWVALARSGPADAPWQADVRQQIARSSARLGVEVDPQLKAASAAASGTQLPQLDPGAVQAAQGLPEKDRQAMVDRMVEGLAAKLRANPADADGWARLLRSRMVLKQQDQAGKDLAVARKALAGNAAGLAAVNAAARELGVPGA